VAFLFYSPATGHNGNAACVAHFRALPLWQQKIGYGKKAGALFNSMRIMPEYYIK